MAEREQFRLTPHGRNRLFEAIKRVGSQQELLAQFSEAGYSIGQTTFTKLLKSEGCSDRDALRARVAGCFDSLGLDPVACIEDYLVAADPFDSCEVRVPPALLNECLFEYYRRKLARADLSLYTFEVDGKKLESPIAVRTEWQNLSIPLKPGHEVCHISDRYFVPGRVGKAASDLLQKYASVWKQQLARSSGREWDDPLFWLQSLELEGRSLKASFALTSFYAYKYSVGLLETELISVLREKQLDLSLAIRSLELRDALLKDAAQLMDTRRAGSSGCVVLFGMARERDYLLLLQQRSKRVTDQPEMLSVVPQGFHAPCQKGVSLVHEWEAQLSETVLREVFEEIFGGEEQVGRPVPAYCREDLLMNDAIRWLHEHPGAWTMEVVGHCCHLMAGERDFAVLMAIHDPEFWRIFYRDPNKRVFKYCWESDDQVDCVSSTDRNRLVSLLRDRAWTGEGPFALIEGLKRLHQIDPSRCIDSLS